MSSKRGDCRHLPCPICFEDLAVSSAPHFESGPKEQGVELLKCGHVFHEECIDRWLRLRGSCPVCRAAEPRITGATPRGKHNWRERIASPDDNFWFSSFVRLSEEYSEVPGVQRTRTRLQRGQDPEEYSEVAAVQRTRMRLQRGQDTWDETDWFRCYRASAAEELAERAAAARAAEEAWQRGAAASGYSSDSGWGGGSCDGGGGGAGGDW